MTFLYNAWYVAFWSESLTPNELSVRTILGQEIVFYRTADGDVAALVNICPHRFASLELGKVVKGDRLRCPYHGLEFAPSGECVFNPNEAGNIPPARMRAFPVVERHSIVWIWMGDRDTADPSAIPDIGVMDEDAPIPAAKRDYITMKANYKLIIDNLLDLSHVSFLHDGILGNDETMAAKTNVSARDGRVSVERVMPDVRPPELFDILLNRDGNRVDLWHRMQWQPVGCILNDARVNEPGVGRDSATGIIGVHLLTPETEKSTHYHFSAVRQNPRPFAPEIADEVRTRLAELRRLAFQGQDTPIIESQQRIMDAYVGSDRQPVLFGVDGGSVAYRRILDRMIEREARSVAR
jgi:vanillate O-demethylase monooxygenase subunit